MRPEARGSTHRIAQTGCAEASILFSVAEAVDKSQVGTTVVGDDPDSVPLVGEPATRYRALAARCNCIAVDRVDS